MWEVLDQGADYREIGQCEESGILDPIKRDASGVRKSDSMESWKSVLPTLKTMMWVYACGCICVYVYVCCHHTLF